MDRVRKKILEEFNKPGLHGHLRRMQADKHTRATRAYTPIVIDCAKFRHSKRPYALEPVRGSIMLFWGRKGSDFIPMLEQAYTVGDSKPLREASVSVEKEMKRRKVHSVESAVDKLIKAPVYFDFNCGHVTLAPHVGLVDGIDYGSLIFPWNGGALNDEDFKVVDYFNNFERAEYDILVVKVPPNLSKIEREALDAVPEQLRSMNIGVSAACAGICLVIVLIIAAATAIAGCASFRDKLAQVSLPATKAKRLGSVASARELVSMRRQVFEKFGM